MTTMNSIVMQGSIAIHHITCKPNREMKFFILAFIESVLSLMNGPVVGNHIIIILTLCWNRPAKL